MEATTHRRRAYAGKHDKRRTGRDVAECGNAASFERVALGDRAPPLPREPEQIPATARPLDRDVAQQSPATEPATATGE